MPTIRPEDLSNFGRLALALDAQFQELSRLSAQIERLDVESESELEHSIKLLRRFAQCGQDIHAGIQQFSTVLGEAREQAERAAKQVSARAELVGQRKQLQGDIQERMTRLEESVKAANTALSESVKAGAGTQTPEARTLLKERFQTLLRELPGLIDTASQVGAEARAAKFKSIEREAEAMQSALSSLSRKIEGALTAL